MGSWSIWSCLQYSISVFLSSSVSPSRNSHKLKTRLHYAPLKLHSLILVVESPISCFVNPSVSNKEVHLSITAFTKPHRREKHTKTQTTLKYAWTLELCTNTESVFFTQLQTKYSPILPHRVSYRIMKTNYQTFVFTKKRNVLVFFFHFIFIFLK